MFDPEYVKAFWTSISHVIVIYSEEIYWVNNEMTKMAVFG